MSADRKELKRFPTLPPSAYDHPNTRNPGVRGDAGMLASPSANFSTGLRPWVSWRAAPSSPWEHFIFCWHGFIFQS